VPCEPEFSQETLCSIRILEHEGTTLIFLCKRKGRGCSVCVMHITHQSLLPNKQKALKPKKRKHIGTRNLKFQCRLRWTEHSINLANSVLISSPKIANNFVKRPTQPFTQQQQVSLRCFTAIRYNYLYLYGNPLSRDNSIHIVPGASTVLQIKFCLLLCNFI
jgi:hypothetical protein